MLKYIKLANGETLSYRERPGGEKVLLLIHGNMNSSKHWDLVMENLDESYKIFAVDLRGLGESTFNSPVDSIKDFSEDIKLFVDALGLNKFHICGWSTGGAVAMQFAANHPDYVEKMILLAPASTRGYPYFTYDENKNLVRPTTKEEIANDPVKAIPVLTAYQNKDEEFLRNLMNLLIYDRNQPREERYKEYVQDYYTQRNLIDIYHALNIFNISDESNGISAGTGEVKQIKAPTIILWGEHDKVVTKEMVLEIEQDFDGLATLKVLSGCGHSPLVDDLEQLLKEMTAFLEKETNVL